MATETKYSIGDDVWVEPGNISYGIIESNGALVLYIVECMLFPTKEKLLKNL